MELFRANDETNHVNEDNMVPTGRRQTSWLFTKHDGGLELGSTEKQLHLSGQSGT